MGKLQNGAYSHFGDTRKYFLFIIAAFLADFSLASSRYKHYHRAPIIDLNGAEELIGIIREDERVVSISPQLRILRDTGPICRYELSQVADSSSKDDFPFESHILDKTDGSAQIRLRNGATIDCSKSEYLLQLVAVRCADDTSRSEAVTLKITVKDTNNHAPEFEAPWYSFDVDEGKTGEIARLYATDADCGHPYGKICRYEITNALDNNPFRIDDQGIISTIQPLNFSQGESHILTVVAHDCGMLSSKSTLVTVHVRPKCIDGLVVPNKSGAGNLFVKPDSVVKITTKGNEKSLLPNVDVQLCARDPVCTVKNAESKMTLYQPPAYSLINAETLKTCGFKSTNVELLSNEPSTSTAKIVKKVKPVSNNFEEEDDDDKNDDENVTKKVDNFEEDIEKNESKYYFDGKVNAVIVNKIKSIVPEKFSLVFSMKHEAGTKQEQSVKQNLLCESDDFAMNRHHFAVYLRHCKLELLLRREAENSVAEFRAAEWRWQASEVCDGKWHSYAIVFSNLDNVKLFIDGKVLDTTERNPEILDDWPLHETKQHKTRLVVGACWHGRQQEMVQHFTGYLAKVFIIPNEVQSSNSIECLHKQQGNFNFGAIDHLIIGESVIFDKTQSELTLKANSLKNLSTLLQHVEFQVDNNSPMTKRRFTVTSHVNCVEEDRTIPLGVHSSEIALVEKAPEQLKKLLISGQSLLTVERQSLKSGTLMLPNIQITITQLNADGTADVSSQHNLDWCKVHLKPSRDIDLEYFSSPAALISFLNVDFEHDKQGIMLKGEESVKNYADVLSKIRYYNTRAESYNKRMYTVHCSMLGGKVLSNEFFVQINIVENSDLDETVEKLSSLSKKLDSSHQEHEPVEVDDSEVLKLEKHFEPSFDQLGANRLQNILEMDLPRPKAFFGSRNYEIGQGAVTGGAVAVVVVVCIGFLLVLLVIGVLKMRDSSVPRRGRRSRKTTIEGMEWDDNGMNMNITVNPLMDVNKAQSLETASAYGSDGEESLDDEESYHEEDELTDDDDDDEGVDGVGILPHSENSRQGLEWDDSTLGTNTSMHNNNVSKAYCV